MNTLDTGDWCPGLGGVKQHLLISLHVFKAAVDLRLSENHTQGETTVPCFALPFPRFSSTPFSLCVCVTQAGWPQLPDSSAMPTGVLGLQAAVSAFYMHLSSVLRGSRKKSCTCWCHRVLLQTWSAIMLSLSWPGNTAFPAPSPNLQVKQVLTNVSCCGSTAL